MEVLDFALLWVYKGASGRTKNNGGEEYGT